MKQIRELLRTMKETRDTLDDEIIAERLPEGFISRIGALLIVHGLDGIIDDMQALIDIAQVAEDHQDERNTQHDALPSSL